uniref:Zinc fingers and homeoboxes 3b n=1 Tax=Tetraodon nigroviridis TaxID=99883 RepID=H3CF97_TETNG
MASKRKSTIPCMIPSKTVRPVEEVEPDSPAVPHQSRIPGDRHSPLEPAEASKSERTETLKEGIGTYTCKLCNFETHDLNLFLDHVYSGHLDFRADPSFFCVSCGISAPKFEGLALHNARVHPSTLNTTLQLKKKDRRVVVEQSLTAGAETCKDGEIYITKTPIMRMLKGKSEAKRIVVSHPGAGEPSTEPLSSPASRETEKNGGATVNVTHVSTIVHNGTNKVSLPSAIQIVNGSGALPLLKTPITAEIFISLAPVTAASANISSTSSSHSSKNLPKVMIPLSSIPTYSASMDSSSFLKTSFNKFPYPTKAELCYLTVVTKFPEEQIKIWFTAQRLKQGISWSPEEIEEARRKMFNTIIQSAPSSSQTQSQSQCSPAPQTITVLPASLGAGGIPHILQGSLVGQGGVIVAPPVIANGIQVSSAPVALAVTPKPQAAAHPIMMDEPSSPASKSSSPSPAATSSSTSGSRTPLSAFLDPSFYKGKKSQEQLGALKDSFQLCQFPDQDEVERLIALTGLTVREVRKWFSDRRYHFRNLKGARASTGGPSKSSGGAGNGGAGPHDQNDTALQNSSPVSPTPSQTPTSPSTPSRRLPRAPSPDFTAIRYKEREPHQVQVRALEASFAQSNEPPEEEVERLRTETKMTRREIHGWFTERRKRVAAEKKREEAEQVLLGAEEEMEETEVSSGKPKVNPIKINLKMLKVTEANGKAEQEGSDAAQPSSVTPKSTASSRPTVVRGKKTLEQLEMLKQVYVRTQWPSATQYDELISGTGLPRPEVVRWFGDCRYMQKNGQLKWLEAYQ